MTSEKWKEWEVRVRSVEWDRYNIFAKQQKKKIS
jgi:hypothetical protein